MKVSVLKFQTANIGSIINMIEHIGHSTEVISDYKSIDKAERIIFPGIGHWDHLLDKIDSSGIRDSLLDFLEIKKKPFLGICLGMQILFHSSEEGEKKGLGLIEGKIKRIIPKDFKIKVPHMGWNKVKFQTEHLLNSSLLDNEREFYFLHSYYASDVLNNNKLCYTLYHKKFTSAIIKDNIIGVQFHPEKSHRYGLELFRKFMEYDYA